MSCLWWNGAGSTGHAVGIGGTTNLQSEDGPVDQQAVEEIANRYSIGIMAALRASVDAEAEAQLTVPVSNLFTALIDAAGLGHLEMIREAQLDGVRPDFAALIDGRPCGWVELKKPGHTLDGDRWTGREKHQWELMAQLDSLVVTDGRRAQLYNEGVQVTDAITLPWSGSPWEPEPLLELLDRFITAISHPVKRVSQLADRLAPLARFIRIRLDEGLDKHKADVFNAKSTWDATVHDTTSPEQFASDVAQVIAYSMAIAALSGTADRNRDGKITLKEAKETLEIAHRNVLAAALGPIIGLPKLMEWLGPEVEAISRLVSSIDRTAIEASTDSRGEPWLWFYEDFLAKYDPQARKRSGVYYTPVPVVKCQVRIIDDLLRHRFGQRLGFGSKSVVTLDPALMRKSLVS